MVDFMAMATNPYGILKFFHTIFLALIFVPVVIAYQIWIYRIFRHKVTTEDIAHDRKLTDMGHTGTVPCR